MTEEIVGESIGRPRSVIQAERLYLGTAVLVVATTAMTWGTLSAAYGAGLSAGSAAFTVGLLVLLTVLATRRGSGVAMWLLVIATALALASLAWQLSSGQVATGLLGVLNAAQPILMLVGAVLLLRPASRAWFARDDDEWADDGDEPEERA